MFAIQGSNPVFTSYTTEGSYSLGVKEAASKRVETGNRPKGGAAVQVAQVTPSTSAFERHPGGFVIHGVLAGYGSNHG